MDKYRSAILALLKERDLGKTICPSEVLLPEQKKDPRLMEAVRESARRLADDGEIEITQKGEIVNPHNIKGPIRLRLRRDTK